VNLGWNWTGNLRPFLVELGRLIGYGFDDSDWIAVEYRIQGTHSEAAPWHSAAGALLPLRAGRRG
jgi:hypothetical protein